MPRTHPPYQPEFERQMLELVRAGRTPQELSREFELSAQAIRNWMWQADLDAGRRSDGLTTEEREETPGAAGSLLSVPTGKPARARRHRSLRQRRRSTMSTSSPPLHSW